MGYTAGEEGCTTTIEMRGIMEQTGLSIIGRIVQLVDKQKTIVITEAGKPLLLSGVMLAAGGEDQSQTDAVLTTQLYDVQEVAHLNRIGAEMADYRGVYMLQSPRHL